MIHQPHGASRDTPARRSRSFEHVRQFVCRLPPRACWNVGLLLGNRRRIVADEFPRAASDTPADLSNVVAVCRSE